MKMSNDCDHRFCPHLHICIFAYRPPDGSLRGQGEPDSFSITLKEEIKYIARGKLNECLLNLAHEKEISKFHRIFPEKRVLENFTLLALKDFTKCTNAC